MSQQLLNIYEFGPYRIDAAKRLLLRDGEPVPITPKCFEILLALVERSGKVVSKASLINRVWPDSFVEEGNLTYNVSVLRKALGERQGEYQYIATIPGQGYQFVATVKEPLNQNADLVMKEHAHTNLVVQEKGTADEQEMVFAREADPVKSLNESFVSLGAQHKWRKAALITALLIVLSGALTYWIATKPDSITGDSSPPAASSVAVLPFALLGPDKDSEAEYLSDGISESIINRLSQLPGVKVIARSSSFKYKGRDPDLQDVAHALGVDAIVTGRVMRRGEQLQISVELMNTRDKTQMWGEQYNRKSIDLLNLQAQISREIAEKLRLKLTAAERQQLAKRETVNPQAYELLLKGRFYWNKGGTENRNKAVEYLNRAIALDPGYASAYAELSLSYCDLVMLGILDPREFTAKAEGAAHKALELDEELAEAHLALAKTKLNDWDWEAAEREAKRAVELGPNLARARSMYGFYLSLQGRHDQAIAEGKRAIELDPLSPEINFRVGMSLLLARQNDQVIEAAKKLLELDQNYIDSQTLIGYAYAAKGQYAEAISAYQKAIKLGDTSPDTQIYLGAAYAKGGQREKALAIVKRLEGSRGYVSGALADLYATLGENEKAFAVLERAYAEHDNQLQFLRVNPNLDPLRSDQRFADLMQRVGLAQ